MFRIVCCRIIFNLNQHEGGGITLATELNRPENFPKLNFTKLKAKLTVIEVFFEIDFCTNLRDS